MSGFENMDVRDIVSIMMSVSNDAQVERAFELLMQTDTGTRDAVVDEMESIAVNNILMRGRMIGMTLRFLDNANDIASAVPSSVVDGILLSTHIYAHLADMKPSIDPLIPAFVDEIMKVSPDDKAGIIRATVKMADYPETPTAPVEEPKPKRPPGPRHYKL